MDLNLGIQKMKHLRGKGLHLSLLLKMHFYEKKKRLIIKYLRLEIFYKKRPALIYPHLIIILKMIQMNLLMESKIFFAQKYINDCINQDPNINPQKILGNLFRKGRISDGGAIKNYRSALKAIFDADSSISDKVNQIRNLDINYKSSKN